MTMTASPIQTTLGAPVFTGAPFVPPYVFSEQERLAPDPKAANQAREHLDDAIRHNLWRLRSSVVSRRPAGVSPEAILPEEQIADFKVYNAKGQTDQERIFLEGNLARRKGQETVPDDMVNAAYRRLVEAVSFFKEKLGFDSIDAKGMVVSAAVHVGVKYNNAYYYNSRICFGDGDGLVFKDFANALSVVAHELSHGLVELALGGLTYWSQSGALNESIADVLGISALQYALGETVSPEATWLMGAECMVPYVDQSGTQIKPALRSMKAPGTAYKNHPRIGSDPQSPTMDGYFRGKEDNYGVHINSGIPNHAYYLAATRIQGDPWQIIIPIWLATVRDMAPNPTFSSFAKGTIKKAGELFPDRPEIKQIIEQAWAEVKVLGKQAISADMAYEIPEGVEGREIIDIFRLDPRLITELENKVQATTLPEGVRRCKVGFVLDENLNASLVCIAYVSEGGKLDLDNLIEGVPVVKFKV